MEHIHLNQFQFLKYKEAKLNKRRKNYSYNYGQVNTEEPCLPKDRIDRKHS